MQKQQVMLNQEHLDDLMNFQIFSTRTGMVSPPPPPTHTHTQTNTYLPF